MRIELMITCLIRYYIFFIASSNFFFLDGLHSRLSYRTHVLLLVCSALFDNERA